MIEGTPNLDTHPPTNALATEDVVMSEIGMASGQWVSRSTAVKRYRKPQAYGSSPTISIWTWSKRASGVGNVDSGAEVCFCTLEFWHWRQARVPTPDIMIDLWPDKTGSY